MIFRKRFEHRFEKAFGFPMPQSSEGLDQIIETLTHSKVRAVKAQLELDYLKHKDKEEKTYRKVGRSFVFMMNTVDGICWSELESLFEHQCRLARKIGLSRQAIKEITQRARQEAERLPVLRAA